MCVAEGLLIMDDWMLAALSVFDMAWTSINRIEVFVVFVSKDTIHTHLILFIADLWSRTMASGVRIAYEYQIRHALRQDAQSCPSKAILGPISTPDVLGPGFPRDWLANISQPPSVARQFRCR